MHILGVYLVTRRFSNYDAVYMLVTASSSRLARACAGLKQRHIVNTLYIANLLE
jgi:hypothetical protein